MSSALKENTVTSDESNWGEPPQLTRRIELSLNETDGKYLRRNPRPTKNSINLCCNDYLCLGGNSAITEAQIATLKGGGDDIYMSAAFLSESTMQRSIELKVAAFLRTEDAVLCQSGWCANVGLMQAITDRKTHVYMDQFVHAGMWEGVQSTGASAHPFRNNDPGDLERLIKVHGTGVVVVSAVYPGNGMVCPLADIADIAVLHGCEMVVDESHSIGVYGRQGEGLVSALGLADKVNYRSFSLSKAMVTRAGMVTGPARIMDFFRYEARPAIFSSAVLQYEIAGLGAALNIIQEENWRRERLFGNIMSLRAQLAGADFNVSLDGSQIVPIFAGSAPEASALCAALEHNNLLSTIINAQYKSENISFVRLLVNSSLTAEDVKRVTSICERVRSELQS